MNKFKLRNFAVLGLVVAAFAMPGAALADPPYGGYIYFNDGNGTCGYAQQTPYGWQIIDTFPCPREVGGD